MSILILPSELLVPICDHLSEPSALATKTSLTYLARSSKVWLSPARKSLYRDIHVSTFAGVRSVSRTLFRNAHLADLVKRVTWDYSRGKSGHGRTRNMAEDADENVDRQLALLGLVGLLSSCPRVDTVELGGSPRIWEPFGIRVFKAIRDQRALVKLVISEGGGGGGGGGGGEGDENVAGAWDAGVMRTWKMDFEALLEGLESWKVLDSIHLSNLFASAGRPFPLVPPVPYQQSSALRTLTLTSTTNIDDEIFRSLLSSCHRLEVLHVALPPKAPDNLPTSHIPRLSHRGIIMSLREVEHTLLHLTVEAKPFYTGIATPDFLATPGTIAPTDSSNSWECLPASILSRARSVLTHLRLFGPFFITLNGEEIQEGFESTRLRDLELDFDLRNIESLAKVLSRGFDDASPVPGESLTSSTPPVNPFSKPLAPRFPDLAKVIFHRPHQHRSLTNWTSQPRPFGMSDDISADNLLALNRVCRRRGIMIVFPIEQHD